MFNLINRLLDRFEAWFDKLLTEYHPYWHEGDEE